MDDAAQKRYNMMMGMLSHTEDRNTSVRSPFCYVGNKRSSLKEILPRLPVRAIYCEPFGGSGTVLLNRPRSEIDVFNDMCSGVVSFYRCISNEDKMIRLINRLGISLHSREEFIFNKATWAQCDDDVERAARWFYVQQFSFQGIGRNFGRTLTPPNQTWAMVESAFPNFRAVHERLKRVLIEQLDWRVCLKDFDKVDAVLYLDPPYVDTCVGAYKNMMTKTDHIEMCEKIMQMQAYVAVSGYSNQLYDSYNWDERHEWDMSDKMTAIGAARGDDEQAHISRGNVKEVLWIKYSRT